MISFDDMKALSNKKGTIGRQLKDMSDMVMQETFDNDIQTKLCYIYDYYHDDQPDKQYGYDPSLSQTKFPVKLKFIVKSYKTFSKDEPDYHIQFEPDSWNTGSCVPEWFGRNYERFGVRFPLGLFVDIPDDRGVYHKWMTVYYENANQFPKIGVIECNYRFMWIENDGVYRHKRKMWGINATQNSYTSGVWRDFKSQVYDDQDKFYLPWNPISAELVHDMRLAVSMLRKNPWTYIVTKIDDTATVGVICVTVKQDKFNPHTDYVQMDTEAPDYGDMFSDYYSSDVLPEKTDEVDHANINQTIYRLAVEAPNNMVKLGNSKVITARMYDANNKDVTEEFKNENCSWNIEMTNKQLREVLFVIDKNYSKENPFKFKFRFVGDEKYLGENVRVVCTLGKYTEEILLDIVTL